MTYELAKKLKDAGFPQDEKGELYFYDDVLTNYCPHGKGVPLLCSHDEKSWKNKKQKPDPVKNPLLHELIAACGEGFYGLNRMDDHQWSCFFMEDENSSGKPIYDTPEEAVSNLWLALNKK